MQTRIIIILLFIALILGTSESATAQQREPKIGYVYPAGGQRGTTLQIMVGGRQIARCTKVAVSGTGVHGRVIRGFQRLNMNSAEENFVARQIYNQAKIQVEGEENLPEDEQQLLEIVRNRIAEKNRENLGLPKMLDPNALPSPEEVMERFPYWDSLAEPTQESLQKVFYEYLAPRTDKKPKEAIGQCVLLELTIDPDAEPGDRDLRLFGPMGLTLPIRFVVGTLPEISELEPNDSNTENPMPMELWGRRVANAPKTLRSLPPLELPIVVNGQIRAGDVDRFQFKAKRGQKLVINVQARHLIPYLADGVPGWFQAAISLFDPNGKKIGESMSYRHEPDPMLLVEVLQDGIYTLEIQDSIFRGRDDFVYRIALGELPLVTSVFPLGVQQGKTTGADIDGWNLPEKVLLLEGGRNENYQSTRYLRTTCIRPIRFAVDDLPQQNESEKFEKLELPIIINGRISDENDVDSFTFEGRKGNRVVLDVAARSLDSPLDAMLELLGPQGNLIASNDDRADSNGPNIGLQTHHADPYLSVELPDDGQYTVRIYDVTQSGGKEYAYRLRISAPRPDFEVFCESSSLTLRGNSQPLKIHVVRKDGFSGEIELRTAKRIPFRINNGMINSETNQATVELSATRNFDGGLAEVQIEAVATVDGKEIVRPVIAVEDMEQAFIYHHWVAAQSLMVFKPQQGFRNRNRPQGN